jgi:hypothetical protein
MVDESSDARIWVETVETFTRQRGAHTYAPQETALYVQFFQIPETEKISVRIFFMVQYFPGGMR